MDRQRNAQGKFVAHDVPIGTKWCPSCKTIKPRSEFTIGRTRPDGLQPRCKSCNAARARARRASDPEHVRALSRASECARRYGITRDEYEALVSRPCDICHTIARPRFVDHCHETGRVRGALCHGCNSSIGLLGEDAERIDAAAEYIRRVCRS